MFRASFGFAQEWTFCEGYCQDCLHRVKEKLHVLTRAAVTTHTHTLTRARVATHGGSLGGNVAAGYLTNVASGGECTETTMKYLCRELPKHEDTSMFFIVSFLFFFFSF